MPLSDVPAMTTPKRAFFAYKCDEPSVTRPSVLAVLPRASRTETASTGR